MTLICFEEWIITKNQETLLWRGDCLSSCARGISKLKSVGDLGFHHEWLWEFFLIGVSQAVGPPPEFSNDMGHATNHVGVELAVVPAVGVFFGVMSASCLQVGRK